MPLARDLLHPDRDHERKRCKLKRLVQSPNSFFMDVKCPGEAGVYDYERSITSLCHQSGCRSKCYKISTVFSHAQTVVVCVGCNTVLCQPTGGKCRLTEGCSFRKKQQ